MIYSVITSAKHGCFILYQENIIAYLNESADSHGFPEKKKRICCKNFYFERTNQPFFKAVLLFTKLVT